MPVYVINLARDAERMKTLAGRLERLGLAFERIPAVYGRDLSATQRAELYDPALNRRQFPVPLLDGEIGCYASHLLVWQRLVDAGEPAALVLEDDVAPTPALEPVLQAIAALPPGWDMVKLIGREVESPWQRWPLCEGIALVRYRRVPSVTAAYVVSQAGARKLLARRRPFGRPVDIDLRHWWECGLNVFGAYPYPMGYDAASTQSGIGRREGIGGPSYRLRKVRDQVRYSIGSWLANRRIRRDNPLAR